MVVQKGFIQFIFVLNDLFLFLQLIFDSMIKVYHVYFLQLIFEIHDLFFPLHK